MNESIEINTTSNNNIKNCIAEIELDEVNEEIKLLLEKFIVDDLDTGLTTFYTLTDDAIMLYRQLLDRKHFLEVVIITYA
jgi:hypothetical protein